MNYNLTQYLCPNRHAICGAVWLDDGSQSEADVQKLMLAALAKMKADPWCAICHSSILHFETGRCRGKNPEDVAKIVASAQIQQLMARATLGSRRNN